MLLQCVSAALQQLARDKHGMRIGVVMVLHTWGQRMNAHPHCHAVVTAGGLSEEETQWITVAADQMFSKEEVAGTFRALFVAGLRRLYRQQRLTMPRCMAWVTDEEQLDEWLQRVLCKRWQANVQMAPAHCQGPEAVLKYLAAYVVGSAIRDNRILHHDGQCVVIRVKNYRTGLQEELAMTGEQFVERFLLHILPDRFRRVRYAGLFSPGRRVERLTKCRALLDAQDATRAPTQHATQEQSPPKTSSEAADATSHRYAPDCPRCAMPGMISAGRHTYHQTRWLLEQLCCLSRRLWSCVSTWDIDRTSRVIPHESIDCIGPPTTYGVTTLDDNTCCTSIPLPDT